ncbi:MAG: hypothetical protein U0575_16780 [Phycisphaerales bacterium]
MPPAASRPLNLARVEGADVFTAAEAIVKGVLESELPVGLVVGARRGSLAGIFELATDERVAAILVDHQLALAAVPDAARSLELALQAACSRRRAVAIVGNDELDAAMPTLERIAAASLPTDSAMCLLLEDHPARCPTSCPRRAMQRLDLPCLEVADVAGLRNGIEEAIRISRAAERAVGLVAHATTLRSADTFEAQPNRVVGTLDVAEAMRHRRRRPRPGEALDLLRMARRLEVNVAESMPNPGETAPLGFIAIGAARVAVRHVLAELRLAGRVPVLHLGLAHPLDEAVVERVLGRCAQVIVLEPRPGALGQAIAASAERLRRRGVACGELWWDSVPPPSGGEAERIGADEALQPSTLVRRTLHLLHDVRPGLDVASRLADVDRVAAATQAMPPRESVAGLVDALAVVREMLEELDRWARRRGEDGEDGAEPTALAIDGIEPIDRPARMVAVECWDRRRFARDGRPPRCDRCSAGPQSWILVVVDSGGDDDPDPERLARRGRRRAAATACIESDALSDRTALRDRLREAVEQEGATVLVVRARSGEVESSARRDRPAGIPALAAARLVGGAGVRPSSIAAALACRGGRRSVARAVRSPGAAGAHRARGPACRVRLRPLLEPHRRGAHQALTLGWQRSIGAAGRRRGQSTPSTVRGGRTAPAFAAARRA